MRGKGGGGRELPSKNARFRRRYPGGNCFTGFSAMGFRISSIYGPARRFTRALEGGVANGPAAPSSTVRLPCLQSILHDIGTRVIDKRDSGCHEPLQSDRLR